MKTFSLFTNIRSVAPYATVSIEDIIPIMQSDRLRQMTESVRTANTSAEKQERKGLLPYITVNGVFSYRNNGGLLQYSELTAIDFDHIPDVEVERVKTLLANDPYTHFMFVSSSGSGLKVFIHHDNTNPELHDQLYPQIIRYYQTHQSIPYVDSVVKDISRATFLAHDPSPYYTPDSTVFHLDATMVEPIRDGQRAISSNYPPIARGTTPMTNEMREKNRLYQMTWKDKTMMDYLQRNEWNHHPEDYEEGNRNNSLLRKARQLCLCGVDYDLALEKLIILYMRVGYSEPDIISRAEYAYRTNQHHFGTDRQKWLDRRNEGQRRYNFRYNGAS